MSQSKREPTRWEWALYGAVWTVALLGLAVYCIVPRLGG